MGAFREEEVGEERSDYGWGKSPPGSGEVEDETDDYEGRAYEGDSVEYSLGAFVAVLFVEDEAHAGEYDAAE